MPWLDLLAEDEPHVGMTGFEGGDDGVVQGLEHFGGVLWRARIYFRTDVDGSREAVRESLRGRHSRGLKAGLAGKNGV